MQSLPERGFYSLNDIQNIWQTEDSDLKQWLMHGQIKAHVWLPMISVFEMKEEAEGSRIIITKELRHWEGYTPLYPHHCRKIFKAGKVYLREFICSENDAKLVLPDTADSLRFDLDDLVILNEERKRFENQYCLQEKSICSVKIIGRAGRVRSRILQASFDPTFKKLTFDGKKYSFGDMQADVLRQLYEASLNGSPWQNGKQLLAKAGSQSFTLANIFKRNPTWRQLITSDERGSYRLSESLFQSLKDHQPITT